MKFDLIIIGAGPAGISCAIEAAKSGLSYCVLEKGLLVNSLFNFPANMTFFSTSQKLEIADVPFISHQDKPTRTEALEYYRRLMFHFKLNIATNNKVLSVNGADGDFDIVTEKGTYHSKKIIVATGFYDIPRMLEIPGENLPKVKHYYDDVHYYIKKDVVIVGGANSACDAALECWQKGANVTMVVREKELYQNVKYWILPNIENRIKEGAIKAHFNSHLTTIRKDEVDINIGSQIITLKNDYVLAMTGYLPNFKFMEDLGISIKKTDHFKPSFKEETLESNIDGIYIAGVILSGDQTSKLFIENTRHHGRIIVSDLKTKIY
jgi:thioredoxin reductase (NADPH)